MNVLRVAQNEGSARVANRPAHPVGGTRSVLPEKLVQRPQALDSSLTKQEPEARVRTDLGVMRDTDLDDEWEEDLPPELLA